MTIPQAEKDAIAARLASIPEVTHRSLQVLDVILLTTEGSLCFRGHGVEWAINTAIGPDEGELWVSGGEEDFYIHWHEQEQP